MSIEFADPTMLALPDDLGGAMRAFMPEMLETGGSAGFLPLHSLRSQAGMDELAAAGSAGWEFAPDQWFEVPSSLAALSAGGSVYAYAADPDPAGPAPLPSGGSDTAATAGGDGTTFTEAGSTLLVTTPAAYESEGEGGDDDEGVTITGIRPPVPEVNDGDNGTSPGGGGAGEGGDSGGETEQNDCRDRAALAATEEIKNENDNDADEHASVIYRDNNGEVRRSPLIEGDNEGIPLSEIVAWLTANSISMSQVIGLVHNHPWLIYGATPELALLNRYPSGGVLPGGDWPAATYMVNRGAGGAGGANFAMYVIDTKGNLREFHYSDHEFYENLLQGQREGGTGLPEKMEVDGTACN